MKKSGAGAGTTNGDLPCKQGLHTGSPVLLVKDKESFNVQTRPVRVVEKPNAEATSGLLERWDGANGSALMERRFPIYRGYDKFEFSRGCAEKMFREIVTSSQSR